MTGSWNGRGTLAFRSDSVRCDALILGGGPAGSAFAISAAAAGLSVVLAERRGYVEARPGEHLAGSARLRLAALGVPDAPGLCRFSPGVLSFWRGAVPAFRSYGGGGGSRGFSTDRSQFDAALFAHAACTGATTVLGDLARAEWGKGRWRTTLRLAGGGTMDLDAGIIADATGRAATFVRRRGIGRRQVGDLFAVVTWLAIPLEAGLVGAPLIVGACRYGWWSLVEAGDLEGGGRVLSLAAYVSQSAMRDRGIRMSAVTDLVLASSPYLAGRLERVGAMALGQAIYPAFPCRAASMWGEGWLAVGDSAAAYDPISGQGVASALEMAERAAEVVAFDPGLTHLGSLYEEALDVRFRTHLSLRQNVYEEGGGVFGSEMLDRLIGDARSDRRWANRTQGHEQSSASQA